MSTSSLHPLPAPRPGRCAALRAAFLDAGFTADGLLDLLGAPSNGMAYAALARGETVPAERATRDGGGAPAVLTRLFLLRQAVARERAAGALPGLDEMLADGWLVPDGADRVRAAVDIRPYSGPGDEDWYVVSDLGCAVGGSAGAGGAEPAADRSALVLGVGGASTTLAGLTVREPGARVLDLGTGSGIQALHAAQHAEQVTATDVNPRALRCAELTLALSGAPEADLRAGSLFAPVGEDERFDLIVSNPPFVISPARRLVYRDGGMAGDDLCRTLVQQAGGYLADGGYCQLLANWEHLEGEDWRERLGTWVPAGCDAWFVERERQDPAEYAELWLRDAGDHRGDPAVYAERYDAWLAEFEARKTRAIGFGWITLRKSFGRPPVITVEEWPHPVEQPLGPEVAGHFSRQAWLRATGDETLLATRFTLAADVVQEQVGPPGAEDPAHVVLRQGRGMRRANRVDTVGAGFAGACDGALSAGRILDAIAQLTEDDPARLRERTPAAIRGLVEQGFLEPVRDAGAGPRTMRTRSRRPERPS